MMMGYLTRLNKQLGREQYINSKFTVANWIGIVFGTLLWLRQFLPDAKLLDWSRVTALDCF
jgi:hypothetical protein